MPIISLARRALTSRETRALFTYAIIISGVFAQDTWTLRANLTVNYGLRWDVLPPWHEKYNQRTNIRPRRTIGGVSRSSRGIVFPGDPGIPAPGRPPVGLTFRLASVWRSLPNSGSLSQPFRPTREDSIRAGFGIFYTAIEGFSAGIMSACAPYGYDYDSTGGRPSSPSRSFEPPPAPPTDNHFPRLSLRSAPPQPYRTTRSTGRNIGPSLATPPTITATRRPTPKAIRSPLKGNCHHRPKLGYVGTRPPLLVLTPADPGNASANLSVSQPNQVEPGTQTCGPFSEGGIFARADGTQITFEAPSERRSTESPIRRPSDFPASTRSRSRCATTLSVRWSRLYLRQVS